MYDGQWTFEVNSRGVSERGADARTAFEYDALTPRGRRKSAPARITREDTELIGGKRVRLQANARDIAKNFAIAGWALRRHLDYVASFAFFPTTGDRALDKELQQLMEISSRPLACDRGGRLGREKMFRLLEASRGLDGDMLMVRMRDGRTQLIESDLIKNPTKIEADKNYEWVEGVQIDSGGWARQYSVHKRTSGGNSTEYSRTVPMSNAHLYGFFERGAADQVRGVSPFVSALNPFRDVYEGIDYSLVKWKINQMLALVITRSHEAPALDDELPVDGVEVTDAEADAGQSREFDLSGGPTVMDMDPGEGVAAVESGVPGPSFDQFMDLVIAVGLKSFDIPYSFYNERFTNYSGSRTAWLHYERSCEDKRADQVEARRRWTLWQMQRWIADGLWSPPSGKTIGDMRFQWVARGMPWWKPSEEIVGDLKAIAGGLDNPQRVCHQRDKGDVYDNIDKTIEVIKYARERGQAELGEVFNLNFEAAFATGGPADGA
jgi:capsid protein